MVMQPALLEVYRSPRASDCEERAFMLTAVGVPNVVEFDGQQHVIAVDAAIAEIAGDHLARYAAESKPLPQPPPSRHLHSFAWLGCLSYALALLVVTYSVAAGLWRLDAFDLGSVDAARIKAGEWWRAWTALTLHVDAAHLATNLGAGVWFGYLAGRQLGSGATWLLAVLGAGVANLVESLLGPASHRAVGASTAVFTLLGILAAYSWRDRFQYPQRWALRWGPLIAGVILLGWLGTEGEHTDVIAHLSGFLVGGVIGVIVASRGGRALLARIPQWASGLAAAATMAGAWIIALTR